MPLHVVALIAGLICTLGVALDAFQTIVLPRRPAGRFQITRFFFILTWKPWRTFAEAFSSKKIREQIYSIYGPLSLLLLLLLWAVLLITGFALIYYSMPSPFGYIPFYRHFGEVGNFGTDLYVSGTTLFTLGLGDVVPHSPVARALIICESGVGLGFVALVIGYVPVLYQAFSHREVSVALLDARAGSPPSASELLRRHSFEGGQEALMGLMSEWERWSAEILESHISYPILCYYRSQHDTQSWLSALVSILDTCALLISVIEGTQSRQAQLTFVIARHALIDLAGVFRIEEQPIWKQASQIDRLPASEFNHLCSVLGEHHLAVCGDPASARRLRTIRARYEPYAYALSDHLRMPLPVWFAPAKENDQWSVLTRLRNDADIATKNIRGSADLHEDDPFH